MHSLTRSNGQIDSVGLSVAKTSGYTTHRCGAFGQSGEQTGRAGRNRNDPRSERSVSARDPHLTDDVGQTG